MKKKIILGTVVLAVIAGLVFGYTLIRKDGGDGETYKLEALKKGDVEALVVTTGTLNPMTIVDVGSQVSGKIVKLYVDFNTQVKAGEVIAELDQEPFNLRIEQNEANFRTSQAALERARVTMENAKKKLDRAMSLFEKDLISFEEKDTAEVQFLGSKADFQSAEARLEQSESQLNSSKVDLGYCVIRSPIDGVVIDRRVNIGQTVAASFQAPVLFQIANDLSKMQVECVVDEADIGKVKEGQGVKFTVDAFPNENFTGVVSQVRYAPVVVQNVVTYTTIAEVDNPELKLRPGMTATASIVTGEAKGVLLVPNAALRYTPDLSPEQMRQMWETLGAMRGGRSGSNGGSGQRGGQTEGQRGMSQGGSRSGTPSMGAGRAGGQSGPRRQITRVWTLTETGGLKPVMLRAGVTDNSYTEVLSGDLVEGQEVITGSNSSGSSNRNFNNMGRMMRMMR